jgi:hypothetical protein
MQKTSERHQWYISEAPKLSVSIFWCVCFNITRFNFFISRYIWGSCLDMKFPFMSCTSHIMLWFHTRDNYILWERQKNSVVIVQPSIFSWLNVLWEVVASKSLMTRWTCPIYEKGAVIWNPRTLSDEMMSFHFSSVCCQNRPHFLAYMSYFKF